MSLNPIHKVLSTLRAHRVRFLLMGGQACVFYGGAEFSRDTDIVLLAEPQNLLRLRQAMRELRAECVGVPPLRAAYLQRGHAVHFRCRHPAAFGMRLDVMSVLRGVASFPVLWKRRTTFETGDRDRFDVIGIHDLVQAKKTQRDKDWPMIRRLLEAHFAQHQNHPTPEQIAFWLREMRTASLLKKLARTYQKQLTAAIPHRPLLALARDGDEEGWAAAIENEERQERDRDRSYWTPLKKELEKLRHARLRRRR